VCGGKLENLNSIGIFKSRWIWVWSSTFYSHWKLGRKYGDIHILCDWVWKRQNSSPAPPHCHI
jgi:hypothetical protein